MTTRIVLADDHRTLVSACKRLLAPEFDVVAVVHSGRDALTAVAEHDPDVLVIDISMPDMNGIEVLLALRSRGVRPHVVVLTQQQDAEIAERVLALGASGFVTKARMARDLTQGVRAVVTGDSFCSPLPE